MFFEWQDNQAATLVCIDKYFETNDAITIRLAVPCESFLFQFKAGQFINIGVEIAGKMEFRAYSISSTAGEDYLQLTIKRVKDGKVSNFIIDSLVIGETVQVLPPTGEFNCIDHPPRQHNGKQKALLISAGCGISPVMAMAKHLLSLEQTVDITFLHIARSPQETIYFDLLETLHAVYKNFSLKLLLKNQGGTYYPQGRLDKQWLQELVPDLLQRTVYLCGSNQFMQDVQGYLVALGFNMENFFQESFTPDITAAKDVTDESVQVTVQSFNQIIEATKGEVLADVLEREELPLIVACRSGICGSCKCKVNDGGVQSGSHQTLTEDEVAQGYVLACSSTIESNLTIELG